MSALRGLDEWPEVRDEHGGPGPLPAHRDRPDGAAPGPVLRVTLCRDAARFAALGPEWDALHARSPAATPFQTHGWLHSWWLSYGVPGRLRLLLVRAGEPGTPGGGRLVGAAALMLTLRPLPVLVPLGGRITDFTDVLTDAAYPDRVARALAQGLRRTARTAVVDLREIRPGAAAERLAAHWDGPARRRADSVCLEVPAVPIAELLRRMPGNSARRTRGKLRRLDTLGVEHRSVPEPEVPGAVANLLRLHSLQWQGRRVTPEHLRPRFAEHLARAASGMVRSGNALVTEYRIDGEVLATDLTLISADLSGGYLYGAHPDLRAKADITTMLLRHDAQHAASSGRRVLSMLRGTEPYKRHWRPVEVTNQRLLLARPELAPLLAAYAAAGTVRRGLGAAVRSHGPALRQWRGRLRGRLRGRRTGRGASSR